MRNPLSAPCCASFVAVSLALAGCAAAPYDECFGYAGHAGWRATETPSERDSLLDLVTAGKDATTARKYLNLADTGEQDAWFRNADGRLLACAHAPGKHLCNGSSGRFVEFHKNGDSWTAGEPQKIECVGVTS